MNIDAEVMLQEVGQLAAQAAVKNVTYAGQIGFLTKRVAELEAAAKAKSDTETATKKDKAPK